MSLALAIMLICMPKLDADPPQLTFWVAAVQYSWEDAAALSVKSHGQATIIPTGDSASPYVSVIRVRADFVLVPPMEEYGVQVFSDKTLAAARIAAVDWVRVGSAPSGEIIVVTRR